MRASAQGEINDRIRISGHPYYPAYLIRGGRRNLMVEAGLNILGPVYLGAIKDFLGDAANLDLLLVTHGHYDHIGALPYLKRKIQNLELRAHPSTCGLLSKEKVLNVMNSLSRQTWKQVEAFPERVSEEVEIGPVPFGEPLCEGDVIDLGDYTCEILETPGHTRDHLSFFLPEPGVLFSGEALGTSFETEDEVKVEFLSSYTDYLESMEKLLALMPRIKVIAMSHHYYYTGKSVVRFMETALRDTVRYRERIESYLNTENGDIERATSTMLRVEYDEKGTIRQERDAYALNLAAQVKAVAALYA